MSNTATALRVGLETLRANPLRTILSTLGIVIGVASLVAVLAVGDGMEKFGLQSIEDEGMQTIVVQPVDGQRVDGVWIGRAPTVALRAADAVHLATQLPPGSDVAMRAMSGGLVSSGDGTGTGASTRGRARGTMIVGTLPGRKDKARPVAHGRAITPDEARTGARVAFISTALADSLAAPRPGASLVGSDLRFANGTTFRVVGIAAPDEERRTANLTMVPVDALAAAVVAEPTGRGPAPSMSVQAPTVGDVPAVRRAVETWIAARFPDARGGLKVEQAASPERVEQMRRGILAFKLFTGAIVGISLLVGGIGIMNVLLSSVTERTREIGIRKTTGARARDILEQFLAESVVITGVGAALGAALGLAGAFGITALIRHFAQVPIHAAVGFWTLLIAIGVSVAVGLIFGTYPARRAAGLSPIEAIRHE